MPGLKRSDRLLSTPLTPQEVMDWVVGRLEEKGTPPPDALQQEAWYSLIFDWAICLQVPPDTRQIFFEQIPSLINHYWTERDITAFSNTIGLCLRWQSVPQDIDLEALNKALPHNVNSFPIADTDETAISALALRLLEGWRLRPQPFWESVIARLLKHATASTEYVAALSNALMGLNRYRMLNPEEMKSLILATTVNEGASVGIIIQQWEACFEAGSADMENDLLRALNSALSDMPISERKTPVPMGGVATAIELLEKLPRISGESGPIMADLTATIRRLSQISPQGARKPAKHSRNQTEEDPAFREFAEIAGVVKKAKIGGMSGQVDTVFAAHTGTVVRITDLLRKKLDRRTETQLRQIHAAETRARLPLVSVQ